MAFQECKLVVKDMFTELGSQYEEQLLQVASDYVANLEETEDSQMEIHPIVLYSGENLDIKAQSKAHLLRLSEKC